MSSNPDIAIQARQLAVGFPGHANVLDGLDLSVPPGEVVGLLGPSGCGKSTLLRTIAGLQASTAGELNVELKPLAYVFQESNLLPWRTTFENVILPLELAQQKTSDAKDRVVAALTSVGLSEQAWTKFPRQLSGGMRMRASIARALVVEPRLLLLDEPFAALDEYLRMKLNDLVLELWEQQRLSIMFVTHNIAEAVYLSHRILVMGGGRIAAEFANALPWPRNAAVRSSVEFAQNYGAVSRALEEASARGLDANE